MRNVDFIEVLTAIWRGWFFEGTISRGCFLDSLFVYRCERSQIIILNILQDLLRLCLMLLVRLVLFLNNSCSASVFLADYVWTLQHPITTAIIQSCHHLFHGFSLRQTLWLWLFHRWIGVHLLSLLLLGLFIFDFNEFSVLVSHRYDFVLLLDIGFCRVVLLEIFARFRERKVIWGILYYLDFVGGRCHSAISEIGSLGWREDWLFVELGHGRGRVQAWVGWTFARGEHRLVYWCRLRALLDSGAL